MSAIAGHVVHVFAAQSADQDQSSAPQSRIVTRAFSAKRLSVLEHMLCFLPSTSEADFVPT
jgi:hypothetical protein